MATKHQRQLIREAVRACLMDRTDAAERVLTTRVIPLESFGVLPLIAIYTRSETVDQESQSTAPRRLTRTLQLAVEAYVTATEDVDGSLDEIARTIEKLMAVDPALGGACCDSILAGTEMSFDSTGEQDVGIATLTFTVNYETEAPEAEDVPLENLTTVDTKTSLGGTVLPQDQAEDIITLPTT
jgi:hypothetical protein